MRRFSDLAILREVWNDVDIGTLLLFSWYEADMMGLGESHVYRVIRLVR
jgi:hypothetical protein